MYLEHARFPSLPFLSPAWYRVECGRPCVLSFTLSQTPAKPYWPPSGPPWNPIAHCCPETCPPALMSLFSNPAPFTSSQALSRRQIGHRNHIHFPTDSSTRGQLIGAIPIAQNLLSPRPETLTVIRRFQKCANFEMDIQWDLWPAGISMGTDHCMGTVTTFFHKQDKTP